MPVFTGPPFSYRRVMIFIDGGYLREEFKKLEGTDGIDYQKLSRFLVALTNRGPIVGELIRAYYYDAIIEDISDPKHQEQDKYLKNVRRNDFYEVRLGRLVRTPEGYRQKGVDALIATDMIQKAYQGHYEIAVLLAGDDDLLDVVKAVKDSGKRIHGVYFQGHVSSRLEESFDVRHTLGLKEANELIQQRQASVS